MLVAAANSAELQMAGYLVTLAGSGLTALVMQGLKKVHAKIDNLPPHFKALIVLALSAAVTKLSALVGVQLPVDVSTWGGGTISTVITTLLAMGIHSTKALVPSTSTDTTPAKS